MRKPQRYLKEVGEKSKTGKTYVRVTPNGRKYYYNPNTYHQRKQKENEERIKQGLPPVGNDDITRQKPYCYDKDNDAYMRYWKKKEVIRNEYPKWVHMSREQYREYYIRVLDLIHNDADYKQWKWETRTFEEKEKDEWWEQKKRKEDEYDGHNDEYDWK